MTDDGTLFAAQQIPNNETILIVADWYLDLPALEKFKEEMPEYAQSTLQKPAEVASFTLAESLAGAEPGIPENLGPPLVVLSLPTFANGMFISLPRAYCTWVINDGDG